MPSLDPEGRLLGYPVGEKKTGFLKQVKELKGNSMRVWHTLMVLDQSTQNKVRLFRTSRSPDIKVS